MSKGVIYSSEKC